ncbi:hypothetical protein V8G54_005999 [Vigna mungo]|uniref:WAT1-related protein n=1 Tax=Vigna mungo TaxID=3915 RepID=A0AAQ3S609_VIGMU
MLLTMMEEVRWRNSNSQVKVLGTIASIAGEFIVILYKGPLIFKKHSTNFSNQILQFLTQLNWILGGIFCIADSLFLLQCGTYIRLLFLFNQTLFTMKKNGLTLVYKKFKLFYQTS